jgi:dihydrofolate reductase
MGRTKKQLPHKKQPVIIIAAITRNNGLGNNGDLLFHLKKDMEMFKQQTIGHTVIMGRKTWESLPEHVRPLPNRENIIVTRNFEYRAKGAKIAHRFYEALSLASPDKKIFVIGGGEIYRQALSYADTLQLTIIDVDIEADAFFPEYHQYFSEESRSKSIVDEKTGVHYSFVHFIKK